MKTGLMMSAGVGALLLAAAAGRAQNAWGDGRMLERQLQVTDRWEGNVPRPDFRDEVRLRNAVVTGNVGGGKSFQSDLTYGDPDDFRGTLGSDSLFRFRRDSFGAGRAGYVGLRSTESLQYQYTFGTGNARDTRTFTRGVGNMPASTGAVFTRAQFAERPAYDTTGSDDAAPVLGTLRSSASFTSSRNLSPALVGYTNVREGVIRVTASSLLGIRQDLLIPDPATGRLVERTPYGTGPNRPTLASAAPAPVKTAYDRLREDLDASTGFTRGAKPAPPDDKPAPDKPAPGPSATDKPPTPGAHPSPTDPKPTDQPESKPTEGTTPPAAGQPPPAPGEAPKEDPSAKALEGWAPWEIKVLGLRDRIVRGKPEKPKEGDTPRFVDDELLDILKRTNPEVSSYLAEAGPEGDLFSRHMQEGEEMLAKGRYFDAEERFARALAITRGDPAASAGRLHAQMGAGLYLSAAINLRQLFEQHPEVMTVRYTGKTLPPPERLQGVREELRAQASPAKPGAARSGEAAMLLAYVSYQMGDQAGTAAALDVMRSIFEATVAEPVRKAGGEPPHDAIMELMEALWKAPAPAGGGGK
jgi:hypothetical protein